MKTRKKGRRFRCFKNQYDFTEWHTGAANDFLHTFIRRKVVHFLGWVLNVDTKIEKNRKAVLWHSGERNESFRVSKLHSEKERWVSHKFSSIYS